MLPLCVIKLIFRWIYEVCRKPKISPLCVSIPTVQHVLFSACYGFLFVTLLVINKGCLPQAFQPSLFLEIFPYSFFLSAEWDIVFMIMFISRKTKEHCTGSFEASFALFVRKSDSCFQGQQSGCNRPILLLPQSCFDLLLYIQNSMFEGLKTICFQDVLLDVHKETFHYIGQSQFLPTLNLGLNKYSNHLSCVVTEKNDIDSNDDTFFNILSSQLPIRLTVKSRANDPRQLSVPTKL